MEKATAAVTKFLIPACVALIGSVFWFEFERKESGPTKVAITGIPSEDNRTEDRAAPKAHSTAYVVAKAKETAASVSKPEKLEFLPPQEEQRFFNEIEEFFSARSTLIGSQAQNEAVARLNQRYEAGVNSIIRELKEIPDDTDVMHKRLALVEYLRYRSRWDTRTRSEALKLVSEAIASDIPKNIRAMKIQEKCELMQEIARFHPEAISVLEQITNPVEKRWISDYIKTGLRASGKSEEEVAMLIEPYYRQ